MQVDEGSAGKDGDHQALILAPKASKQFVIQRTKKEIKCRPMPDSKIKAFNKELTEHRWDDINETEDLDEKVDYYHKYVRSLLDKHFPEKTVKMTNLDKFWITPQLKQLLRQAQRERILNGKSSRFKKLWNKFRSQKRSRIKNFNQEFVEELKQTEPGKWYSMMKKLGGLESMDSRGLEIESLKGLSDQECAEEVARSFAAVSQQYGRLDRSQLPAFLPAGRPEQVNVFDVWYQIKRLGKTKSTLPIDIPDKLRVEVSLDLAEPLTNIINSCLRAGSRRSESAA